MTCWKIIFLGFKNAQNLTIVAFRNAKNPKIVTFGITKNLKWSIFDFSISAILAILKLKINFLLMESYNFAIIDILKATD